VTLGATLATSFLVTLANPSTWPLALAAFLLRGGLVLVIAPILVLPSAVGVANIVGPWLTTFVFAGVTPSILAVGLAVTTVVMVWLLLGGLLAAVAEVELVRIVATDDDVVTATDVALVGIGRNAPASSLSGALRVLVVHLLAQGPLVVAAAWGGVRIVTVTYRELTLPSDVTVPIAVRVVAQVPEAIAAIALAWWLGQVVGSVAARRVVLCDTGIPRSLASAVAWLVRHPVRGVVLESVPGAALVVVLVPSAAASAAAWSWVRASLATIGGPLDAIIPVVLLVALWTGGLVLAALVTAWRAATWTIDAAGTFGVTGPAERGTGPGRHGLPR
jgi:hypothetical protein